MFCNFDILQLKYSVYRIINSFSLQNISYHIFTSCYPNIHERSLAWLQFGWGRLSFLVTIKISKNHLGNVTIKGWWRRGFHRKLNTNFADVYRRDLLNFLVADPLVTTIVDIYYVSQIFIKHIKLLIFN